MVVIGINTQDDAATVEDFVGKNGITFEVGWDESSSYQKFRDATDGISPFPIDVVVDADGNIAYLEPEWDVDALRAALDQLIGGS